METAMDVLRAMRRNRIKADAVTYNTMMQGWIELKRLDLATEVFDEMKRRNVRRTVVTYTSLISGWARSMQRMDKAEAVMKELMEYPHAKPNTRTFDALINGYNHLLHENHSWRADRMYFWLCKMRDLNIKPSHHTAKHFSKMNLHFPSPTSPFWIDYDVPYDPHKYDPSFNNNHHHYHRRRR